jgi:hypothetical protein
MLLLRVSETHVLEVIKDKVIKFISAALLIFLASCNLEQNTESVHSITIIEDTA